MKICLHHTFQSVKELKSVFNKPDDDDSGDDVKLGENETTAEGDDLMNLESSLQEDFAQLANEEMKLVSQGDDEEGTDKRSHEETVRPGQTEDEPICLSDDEDDTPSNCDEEKKVVSSQHNVIDKDFRSRTRVLQKYRFYKQFFEGESYGIQLLLVCDRLAVAKNRFGRDKPALGDVLVAINGYRLPLGCPLGHACGHMRSLLRRDTVELTFVEDEAFKEQYSGGIKAMSDTRKVREKKIKKTRNNDPPNINGAVIEILD